MKKTLRFLLPRQASSLPLALEGEKRSCSGEGRVRLQYTAHQPVHTHTHTHTHTLPTTYSPRPQTLQFHSQPREIVQCHSSRSTWQVEDCHWCLNPREGHQGHSQKLLYQWHWLAHCLGTLDQHCWPVVFLLQMEFSNHLRQRRGYSLPPENVH